MLFIWRGVTWYWKESRDGQHDVLLQCQWFVGRIGYHCGQIVVTAAGLVRTCRMREALVEAGMWLATDSIFRWISP